VCKPWVLGDELPELAEYAVAGLAAQGYAELVQRVGSMRVHSCSMQTSHAALHGVPEEQLEGFMANPERRRYTVGSPRGLKRRPWVITLDVIDGVIYVLAVSHPGSLRARLRELSTRSPPPKRT
jgi:hypothetical protein